MKLNAILFGICLFALPAGADTQTEILSDKLERLESEMALIQKKVYQIPENQSSASAKMPRNIDEFYAMLETQNKMFQELTQKNEQMSHELSELKDKLSRMNDDFNFRFEEIKKSAISPLPYKENAKESIKDSNEEENYNNAYTLLKNGEYDKAEQSFLTFMEKYPNGKFIGNANYWLAESYYARKKWPEAAGLFADGFTKYKDNPKATDSMFKLGLTMKQMDKQKEACTAFKKLLKESKNLNKQLKERIQKEVKELKCS